jgi:branched-subunit amino acid permease
MSSSKWEKIDSIRETNSNIVFLFWITFFVWFVWFSIALGYVIDKGGVGALVSPLFFGLLPMIFAIIYIKNERKISSIQTRGF